MASLSFFLSFFSFFSFFSRVSPSPNARALSLSLFRFPFRFHKLPGHTRIHTTRGYVTRNGQGTTTLSSVSLCIQESGEEKAHARVTHSSRLLVSVSYDTVRRGCHRDTQSHRLYFRLFFSFFFFFFFLFKTDIAHVHR